MRTWLIQHARALGATLASLARTPLASLLNVAVIGIALAFPLGLYVALVNLQSLARTHGSAPQLSLFMALDASSTDVSRIENRLRQHPRVHKFSFVPREQALRELTADAGLAEVVESMQHNPLPDAFVVDAARGGSEALEALREELGKWPKIAHVQLDSAWARRLDALLNVGRFALTVLATALAFGMLTVTFNTIRLQILTQREVIEVSRLLGATDPFIRRPFLYYGALLGALGALAAWVVVWVGAYSVNHSLAELSQLYGSDFRLRPLAPEDSGSLLLFSTWLCWLGARLCVWQHLRPPEP